MDKSVIEKIVELRDEGATKEIDGLTFSRQHMNPIYFAPRPEPIGICTLTGLIDYLEKNVDSVQKPDLMLHIVDTKTVKLISKLCGLDRQRDGFATARVDEKLQEYPFGKYMVVEEFVIRLRSMFKSTLDLEKVIAYTSKLSSGTIIETLDDGISQSATIRTGVSGAVKKNETAPIIVNLKPFRTFRDLDQVESEFLFRIQTDEDGKNPSCALFEADGGKWRSVTIQAIKAWLAEKISDIAIIA